MVKLRPHIAAKNAYLKFSQTIIDIYEINKFIGRVKISLGLLLRGKRMESNKRSDNSNIVENYEFSQMF